LSMELKAQDIEEAIAACISLVTNVDTVLEGAGGKSEIAQPQAQVLQALLKAPDHEMTRIKILQKLFGDVDTFVLSRVVETLVDAKAVTAETRGGHTYYKLTAGYLKQFEEWNRNRDKKS